MLSILIQRFWMEFIDDFEVLAGTYQRFWNSEVPDRIYQRYWNSEFWMEPIDDLKFRGSGCQIMALNSYFEGPGSSVFDFEDEGFFDSWTLKTTGSLVLDFGDDSFAASSQNNWIYKIGQHYFIEKFLERTSKVPGKLLERNFEAEAEAEAGAGARAGGDFLDENFKGLQLLRGLRLLG
ncbi:hypothetical protein GLOIN_2v1872902 [Rhizophagus irregularis DAOM 181602=DAOM 197198]|uniref:Uncharacterized protein n=1 Tax=Rhizophagus irregularis (strain DAOM 181602 / DAOM 197198 / MUCL 43194) TaxID=747089 RepID=A0A2P4QCL4_RHIID|nr:hypothetical protein GLOIN_2v1872902 [Rhizophagus irregularis DAOM 181602=DAOM 197198]POG75388.1 hypothetical protein GLOIN_2v1872902 [Rhizophagus irregularis DAOM 181602=DAOM 197198]|eukprot:XP_025182254.1 hypothetical protein GLOIN_2v1872902 [Rhizophagus irregularis DAOM 181602=DAOM 197198]